MSPPRILVDTGAIYAFVTNNDLHHVRARSFAKRWLARGGLFVLGDNVFAETMTLLKARLGASSALRVGRELRDNPSWHWAPLGPEGERETWATFQKYQDKDWSYTDCGVMVLAHRLRVRQVFAFDHHFLQMPGIERLPSA